MEKDEAIEIIKPAGYFNVKVKDGRVFKKRLFITDSGQIAEADKFRKKYYTGHCVYFFDYNLWDSLEVISRDIRYGLVDHNTIFQRNVKNAIKYLECGLGLNPKFLEKLKAALPLSGDFEKNREALGGILGADTSQSMALRPIETSNFGPGITEIIRRELWRAIKENRPYSSGRHHFNGRDVSIRYEPDKTASSGYNCWYSREYTNCGNGDYYLALDDKHVLFIERD